MAGSFHDIATPEAASAFGRLEGSLDVYLEAVAGVQRGVDLAMGAAASLDPSAGSAASGSVDTGGNAGVG